MLQYVPYENRLASFRKGIKGADIDLDFVNQRLYLERTRAPINLVRAGHTRSSSAKAVQLDGNYLDYTDDMPRMVRGLGLFNEYSATNYSNNLNPQSNNISSGVAAIVEATGVDDPFGGTNAIRLKFGTSGYSNYLFRTGATDPGFSVNTSVFIRLISNNNVSRIRADLSDSPTATFKSISELTLNQWVRVDFGLLPFGSISSKFIDLLTNSDAPTEDDELIIDICGVQLEREVMTSPIEGVRSADRFHLTPEEHNLNFVQGAMFWKGVIFDQSVLYPRLALLGQGWSNGNQFLLNRPNADVNVGLRSGGTNVTSASADIATEPMTVGVTWRPDGTTRVKVHNEVAANHTIYTPPVADRNLYINCSASSTESANTLCKRFVGFSEALSEGEFDRVFAEIAA